MSDFVGSVPSSDGMPLSGFRLELDEHLDTDDITVFPLGVSEMPVTGDVGDGWDGNATDATVVTNYLVADAANTGGQIVFIKSGYIMVRVWNGSAGDEGWEPWIYLGIASPTYILSCHPEDYRTEANNLSGYDPGVTMFAVSALADWNETGEDGHVVTEYDGTDGRQTLAISATSTSYVRYWTGGAWGSWRNTKDADLLDGNDSAYFATATSVSDHLGDTTDAHDATAISYAGSTNLAATQVEAALDELDAEKASTGSVSTVQTNLDNHTGDASDAHDASAISILDTAGQYTATNAEDALAEVLDALQAHEADTVDAHDAAAISYAGSTNLAATTVEAGLDELDSEKLAASSYTAADVLSKLLTVDGSGSGLDADLLDGNSSAYYATASSVSDHLSDAVDAHDASAISFTPDGSIAATTVQAAIVEVRDEATGGTGLSLTEVEKNLGTAPRTSGKFNITSSGLTTGKHVLITQANGPYTGKGTLTDEAQMDAITATGKVTSATNIECYWRSPTKVRGNVKFAYAVG